MSHIKMIGRLYKSIGTGDKYTQEAWEKIIDEGKKQGICDEDESFFRMLMRGRIIPCDEKETGGKK